MEEKTLVEKCIGDEETYQFASFGRSDAWELGCALTEACRGFEGPVAAEIDLNGFTVFRWYPEGTEELNAQWLARKRATVRVSGKSSLRVFAELRESGGTLQSLGLNSAEYVDCGGGFPIRLRGGCVIGFIGTSGLTHTRDHEALIAGLRLYFRRHPEKKG